MVLAGSYSCHATTNATADVLRNGRSKHTCATTTRATHSYGSHESDGSHWAFLQRKGGRARTAWSWRVPAAWGKRYVTTIMPPTGYPLTVFSQQGKQQYAPRRPCHLTFQQALETKTNTRTEMGLRQMSMGWITVVGGMPITTHRQRRDRGKRQLFSHSKQQRLTWIFRKRRASPVLEDTRSKRR